MVAFLLLPAIGRIYSPADFGTFSAALAVAVIMATVATGRYEFAVVPARDAQETRSVGFLALALAVAVFAAAALVLAGLGAEQQLRLAGLFGTALYLIPLLGFSIALYQTLGYWFVRASRFLSLSLSRFIVSGGGMILALSLALLDATELGLTLGVMLGYALASILLLLNIGPSHLWMGLRSLRWQELRTYSRAHHRLPLFYLPAALLDTASFYLPIVLIAYLFTQDASGQYALASRVLAAPLALIGVAVGQVFLQKFSSLVDAEYTVKRNALFTVWTRQFLLGVPPALVVYFWGAPLFELLIGANWADAGKIASIMAPYFLLNFMSSPTSGAYIVLGLQKDFFFYNLVVFGCRLSGYFLGALYLDLYQTLWLLVIVESGLLLLLNYHLLNRLRAMPACV